MKQKSDRKRGRNAWNDAIERQKTGRPPKWMVSQTDFEKLLARYGLNHESAPRNPKMADWIRKNLSRRYVPESILDAMGLEPETFTWTER